MRGVVSLIIVALWTLPAMAETKSILSSPHNLSAAGPSAVRATAEVEVCVFCHTPHRAGQVAPLWNRTTPVVAYKVYSSKSLDALPGQPTGSSKLCLSCHDGTIALGSVLSRSQPISMAGGITTLPPGASNLGTDLSDDHPISFRYDSTLVSKDPKLKDPSLLPTNIRLDKQQEMQCITCHDAHDNSNGKFLVMDNSSSQLCASCHDPGTTEVAGHLQCTACHQPHSAPSGPYLLKAAKPTDTCLACHSGGTTGLQGPNIAVDLLKTSNHDTAMAVNLPAPIPNDVTCYDCHQSHTMKKTTALAPNIRGNFGKVAGVSASGAAVAAAQYEYEVCFKCHADQASVTPKVSRQIVQNNTRLEFATSAVSYHPVEAAGKNTSVPSLRPGYTVGSVIYCSDCHTSDTGRNAGGSGAIGTHGSAYSPLLIARYDTADRTSESAAAYALCYRCHDRNSILADRSFSRHHTHISDVKSPCSVCHDSHGIASAQGTATNNAHLINFNTTVVRPDSLGQLRYERTGVNHGRCYLNCHGKQHSPLSY